ncbi:MAG: putative DNA binding domain-containing protein [Magnetococcales bacterium]|nr:putative DNA binding domain-containing protein [Magnetococcales bacterium]MBF0149157.1 putative DNA binding domain-containing protein [Magnetococcales bacterium]
MTDAELELFLDDLESDRVERKESEKAGDKICQAICAFANDMPDHRLPGVIFVGVKDQGSFAGLAITDQLLQNLSAMRSDGNIVPLPAMTVQKRNIRGTDLAVIIVQPSESPPVRFKGTVWIRVGPRRAIANPDEERRLSEKRRYKDFPGDIHPIRSAPMEGLDEFLFLRGYLPTAVSSQVLAQNHRSVEDQLIATKFAHPGPPVCPTVLGELTIGKDPTDWIPGAFVQFIWIDGHELGDPVQSSQELRLPMPELLREIDQLLKINIHVAVDMTTDSTERRQPDYPLVALQQMVRNAVLHRSYDQGNTPVRIYWFKDRVEIFNPGGPYGQVTKQNFGQPGAYGDCNPNLATVLKDLGYVQQFGMGISLTRKVMAGNGNPPPEFLVEETHVGVILRKRS